MHVMTDFSSGRMVTMSSASRILAIPSSVSAVSKAYIVSRTFPSYLVASK